MKGIRLQLFFRTSCTYTNHILLGMDRIWNVGSHCHGKSKETSWSGLKTVL